MATTVSSGSSARVREVAFRKYVTPHSRKREQSFAIPVRALLQELKLEGFPAGNTPQVCSAIRSRKFLEENDLTIEKIEGPPSGQSTSVIVHYRFRNDSTRSAFVVEQPAAKAKRIIRESAGLLQPAIDQFGNAEGLLAWIRSETE